MPLFLVLIFSAFVSCTNPLVNIFPETETVVEEAEEAEKAEKKVDVEVSFKVTGAYPEILAKKLTDSYKKSLVKDQNNNSNEGDVRSAFPTISDDISYTAVASAPGRESINGIWAEDNRSFVIPGLHIGYVWTITITMYDGARAIMSDTYTMDSPLSAESPLVDHEFILKPENYSGSGQVGLLMQVSKDVSSIEVTCDDDDWPIDHADLTDSGSYWTCDISTNSVHPSIPCGSYNIVIDFKAEDGLSLYTDFQTINIFSNMTTSNWVSNGDSGLVNSEGVYELNHETIESVYRTVFYVGTNSFENGDDTEGTGSVYKPLETITRACNIIADRGSGTKDYKIYVKGSITGEQTISSAITSDKAHSITIIGCTELDDNNLPQDVIIGNGSGNAALENSSTVPLTVKNLKFTGTTYGIRSIDAALVLENCEISGNTTYGVFICENLTVLNCKVSNNSGCGISLYNNALIENSEISNNQNGGIYIGEPDDECSVEINGCTISGNCSSIYGGGIYNFNTPLKIHNTIIENNSSEGSGGGIALWEVAEEGRFELSGTTVIRNNSSGIKGGAIWSQEVPIYIKDSVYIPAGEDNSNDVYFNSEDSKFVINGSLNLPAAAGGKAAYITPKYYTVGAVLIKGEEGISVADEVSKFSLAQQLSGTSTFFISNMGRLNTLELIVALDNGEADGTETNPANEEIYDAVKYSFVSNDNLKVSAVNPYESEGFTIEKLLVDDEDGDTTQRVVEDGFHTVTIRVSKAGYDSLDISRLVYVKIKPVKVQITGQLRGWYRVSDEKRPCAEQHFYLQAGNPNDEYDDVKDFNLIYGDDNGVGDGDHARNYYWWTPDDKNYVWLTSKSSTFYFWADLAYDWVTTYHMGKFDKNCTETTRTLAALKENKSFDSQDRNSSGEWDSSAWNRSRVWITVSLNDSEDPPES